jgi:hypothetical protein
MLFSIVYYGMHKAKIIRKERVVLAEGRFVFEIKAYEVPRDSKYPVGVKLKCVLIDVKQDKPRVLLDNHEPFGFHLHTRLPDDPDYRVIVGYRRLRRSNSCLYERSEKGGFK